MRLSVVIPVYNVARWLPACLDSVLTAANGRAAEVICVDDGSTDASPEILAAHPVAVITQANAGYGAAVNAGLDAARGDFVAIVEPDDRVTPVAWDQPLALLEACDMADFARAPYLAERRWRLPSVVGLSNPPDGVFTVRDRPDLLDLPPAIWSGVYRRASIEALGLRLPETPGAAFQDTYFTMMLLLSGARAIWADQPFYRYRADRPGASRDGRRRTDEILRIHDRVLSDLPLETCADPDFAELFYPTYFRRLLWFFERVAPGFQEEAFRQAYVQFSPVWRNAALTERVRSRLTPFQRAIFGRFAQGRFDAFQRQFRLAPTRLDTASASADFELGSVVRGELSSLLPASVVGKAMAPAILPLTWLIATGLRTRLRSRRGA